MNVELETLRRLVEPFLEQEEKLYVAIGCGKVFVAPFPAGTCKKCKGEHENFEVTNLEDLEKIPLTIDS